MTHTPLIRAAFLYSVPSVCQSLCGTKLLCPWLTDALLCWSFFSHIQVRMGEYNIDVKEDSELVRSAALIIHRLRYDSRRLVNNIVLIKLVTILDYSADIQPTPLSSSCATEGSKCLFQSEKKHWAVAVHVSACCIDLVTVLLYR